MAYRFGSGNKTKNDLLLIINKLAELAICTGKDIVVEDLNFSKAKSGTMKGSSEKGKRYNKMLHSLAYRMFLNRTEQICNRKNVGLMKVNSAWTSWIAKNKFCDKMKLNIHTGASFVIARRGMNIKDVIQITEIPVQMDVLTRYRAYITIWEVKNETKIVMMYLLRSNG